MNIKKISIGKDAPNQVNVIIEVPMNSSDPVKYEMDKDSGALFVDRFVGTGMSYPFNYGFIPHTLSEDGDPCDVVLITPFPVDMGALITCRALGVLKMEDESGVDAKILAVPIKKICPLYANIDKIEDIETLQLSQIKYFFEHYKGLELGKWVKVSGFDDINAAKKEILSSLDRAKNG